MDRDAVSRARGDASCAASDVRHAAAQWTLRPDLLAYRGFLTRAAGPQPADPVKRSARRQRVRRRADVAVLVDGLHAEQQVVLREVDAVICHVADKLRALGWTPSIGLREGIASTYEWFLATVVTG